MTHIQFLHGAPDRLAAAAEWLRGAWQRRQPALVYVPDAAQANRLDHLLWTQPATGFVPHCQAVLFDMVDKGFAVFLPHPNPEIEGTPSDHLVP